VTTSLGSARRYYLRKSQFYASADEQGLAATYQGLHDSVVGTPVPAAVPFRDKLAAAGYTTTEDIVGSDVDELVEFGGLNYREAAAVHAVIGPREFCADASSAPALTATATGGHL